MNRDETKDVAVFLDVSGQPDVDDVCVVSGVFASCGDVNQLGSFLQRLRDMNGYQRSLHFSEVGVMNSCGGGAHTAYDFARAVVNDRAFKVRSRSLIVDCSSFDMKYYNKDRSLAINRLVKTHMLGSLALYFQPTDTLCLTIYVDGHHDQFPERTGLLDYLCRAVDYNSRCRPSQPNILGVQAIAIPRRPLAERGEKRHLQDMVALADIIAGAHAFHASPSATNSAKPKIAEMVVRAAAKYSATPPHLRPVTATLYSPPSHYEELIPYCEAEGEVVVQFDW